MRSNWTRATTTRMELALVRAAIGRLSLMHWAARASTPLYRYTSGIGLTCPLTSPLHPPLPLSSPAHPQPIQPPPHPITPHPSPPLPHCIQSLPVRAHPTAFHTSPPRCAIIECVSQLVMETPLCSRYFEASARAAEKLQAAEVLEVLEAAVETLEEVPVDLVVDQDCPAAVGPDPVGSMSSDTF